VVVAGEWLLISSLLLNWVLGPALMFTLAWAMLPDLPTSGYTDRLIASAKLLARRQIKMHSPGRGPRRLTSHRGPRPRERSSGTTPKLHNGDSALSLCRVAHESGGPAPHYRDELVTRFRAEALVGAVYMSLDGAN